MSEHRHGLIVDAIVTEANGTAERSAAVQMLEALPGDRRRTVGAEMEFAALLTFTGYNLVRMRNLLAPCFT